MFSLNQALIDLLEPLGHFSVFCRLAGFLFLLDLLAYLPFFGVFFGYREDSQFQKVDLRAERRLAVAWLAASLGLMLGGAYWRLASSVFFLALYRHFYIARRWKSVRRGGGAPGFMSHWTTIYLVLLQLSAFLDASGWLTGRVWWMLKIDFGIIMLCAGTYKYLIGYLHADGMEYGRVNPMWGYFWRFFAPQDPNGFQVRFHNVAACLVEIAGALCMLIPGLDMLGAAAMSASFFYVATSIRLGRLSFLMALLPLLYHPGIPVTLLHDTPVHLDTPGWLLAVLGFLINGFVAVLPVVKLTQYLNLFANWHWPQPLQRWISTYANWVPITMWRVFTPDVTNFYIRIYEVDLAGGCERPILDDETYSLRNWSEPLLKARFLHVTESIAITSVFTTLKYFPSKPEFFNEKLLNYARSLLETLGRPVDRMRFEYLAILKQPGTFEFLPVADFYLNLATEEVIVVKREPDFDFSAPSKFSPVRESVAPGSYEKPR